MKGYLTLKPTNVLIHVNTTLFTLLHPYMFYPSRGWPSSGSMTHTFCWPCSRNVSVCPEDGPLKVETCSSITVWMKWYLHILVH